METPLEHILIHANKAGMILFMQSHSNEFEELMELAISNKQPYSWRAAWLLVGVMDANDRRIKKHIRDILKRLDSFKDGHQRCLINVLQKMEIKEEQEGVLFDICVDIWSKIEKQSSVRYKALEILLQITKKHPELINEVIALTQKQYLESLSNGIKRSVNKKINLLTKNKKQYY